jgi:hypothetical protein
VAAENVAEVLSRLLDAGEDAFVCGELATRRSADVDPTDN